eukprot:scaffold9046_cov64-Phaeocystis_antarctica.AAC.7
MGRGVVGVKGAGAARGVLIGESILRRELATVLLSWRPRSCLVRESGGDGASRGGAGRAWAPL